MSRTSLGQSNELKMVRSFVASNYNLSNQLSSKRLSMQFPIETHINITDQLNAIHIHDKYLKHLHQGIPQKQSYLGQTQNGKKEGFGTFVFKNNDKYTGYWNNDKMHGMGVYEYDNNFTQQKYVFMGEFSQGKYNGIGKLILLKSQREGFIVYQGFWENGLKSGYGVYFYGLDTSIYYEGYWQTDMKNGEGRLIFRNGEYSGYWTNDKRNGQGKLRVQNHDQTLIYEGEWKNDELNEGDITYLTPSPDSMRQGSYKGQMKNGKKNGQGVFEHKNIQLKGTFDNDYFTGRGTLYNQQYNIQGDFISDKANLKATIKYLNGDIFEGIVDISTGTIKRKEGKYLFKNGDTALGNFEDQGNGFIKGFFEYLWKDGDRKKYNR